MQLTYASCLTQENANNNTATAAFKVPEQIYVGNKKIKLFLVTFEHPDTENHKTNKDVAMLESLQSLFVFFLQQMPTATPFILFLFNFILLQCVLKYCVIYYYQARDH